MVQPLLFSQFVAMPKLKPTALSRFRARGFEEETHPDCAAPSMPSNITSMTITSLGALMSKYSAWREYTESLHSESVYQYVSKKSVYDYEYAVKMRSLQVGAKTTLAEKKLMVESDKELNDLYQELLEAEMYKDLLAAKVESYNNCLVVISREITRRGQELDNRFNT